MLSAPDTHSAYMLPAHTSLRHTCVSIQPAVKPAEHPIRSSYELLLLILQSGGEKHTETMNAYLKSSYTVERKKKQKASLAQLVGKSGALGGTEWV